MKPWPIISRFSRYLLALRLTAIVILLSAPIGLFAQTRSPQFLRNHDIARIVEYEWDQGGIKRLRAHHIVSDSGSLITSIHFNKGLDTNYISTYQVVNDTVTRRTYYNGYHSKVVTDTSTYFPDSTLHHKWIGDHLDTRIYTTIKRSKHFKRQVSTYNDTSYSKRTTRQHPNIFGYYREKEVGDAFKRIIHTHNSIFAPKRRYTSVNKSRVDGANANYKWRITREFELGAIIKSDVHEKYWVRGNTGIHPKKVHSYVSYEYVYYRSDGSVFAGGDL